MPDHIGKAVSSNESQSPGLCTSERQDITAGQEEEGLGGAQEKEEQTQNLHTIRSYTGISTIF